MNKLILALTAMFVMIIGANVTTAQKPIQKNVNRNRMPAYLDPSVEQTRARWIVLDKDMKIKIALVFKFDGFDAKESDVMMVVGSLADTTCPQELLAVRVGSNPNAVIVGAERLRSSFGDRLYDQIVARQYDHQMIGPDQTSSAASGNILR